MNREFPDMPPFTKNRLSLMQLRPRHSLFVEEIDIAEHYDRSDMLDWVLRSAPQAEEQRGPNADGWADDVRLSDIEPNFTCIRCGKRGADVRPKFLQASTGSAG